MQKKNQTLLLSRAMMYWQKLIAYIAMYYSSIISAKPPQVLQILIIVVIFSILSTSTMICDQNALAEKPCKIMENPRCSVAFCLDWLPL